jgi:integrase/recombinase XerD
MLGVEVKFKTLKRDSTIPSYFEINEAKALLDAVDGSYKRSLIPKESHKALVAILLYGGLRPKEIINLRIENFNENNRTLEIKKTKTKTDDFVVLKEKCVSIIKEWLKYHPTGSGWMFPVKENKVNNGLHDENGYFRPSKRQIRRIVKHYAKKAGIRKRVYTYMLRHTLATSLAFNGCNAFYIQQQMRHKDLRTTRIYVHINKEKQRKAMDKYMPDF